MQAGFIKANKENLPKVDSLMLAYFFGTNPDFFTEESRNVKNSLTSKDNLGDDAVGYVCLKRESSICTVSGKIFSDKIYHIVTLNIDENESTVTNVKCHYCSEVFGCKHSLAFLMWVYRRSEEPEDTRSFWIKPLNAYNVKFITVAQMTGTNTEIETNPALFIGFIKEAKRRKLKNCRLLKHCLKYNKELFKE